MRECVLVGLVLGDDWVRPRPSFGLGCQSAVVAAAAAAGASSLPMDGGAVSVSVCVSVCGYDRSNRGLGCGLDVGAQKKRDSRTKDNDDCA